MGILSNAKLGHNVERAKDVVGGSNFDPVPTGIYDAEVKMVYLLTPDSGSQGLYIELDVGDGKIVNTSEYFMSGDAKGNKFTYEKDGEEFALPGFTACNDLAQLTTDLTLDQLTEREITVERWDSDAQARTEQQVQSFPEIIGKRVKVAIHEQIENKTKLVTGKGYVALPEEVTRNEVQKFMYIEDGRVVNEIIDGSEKAIFHDAWLKQYEGKVRDKRTYKAKPGEAAPASESSTPSGNKQEVTGLFSKKK